MSTEFPNTRARQGGFTLVEIAIVLVIVGLLLGGVLKGQALIEGARVTNTISQVKALQTAVYGFQDRYRVLPGNMSNAAAIIGGTAVNCTWDCNDGDIRPWRNSSLALNHLAASGFYSGTFPTAEINAAPTAANAPTNPFGGAMFIAHWNRYADSGTAQTQLGVNTGRSIPSSVLAEIDRKLDDGLPQTGSFRAAWPTDRGGAAARCFDATNNTWLTTGTDCAGVSLM